MADYATFPPGMSSLQRTWQSLSPPVSPPGRPMSPGVTLPQPTGFQLLPPQIAATPPQATPTRGQSAGSMSISLTSRGASYSMQRPNSTPSLVSPRQPPPFLSPRVASPNQRKGYPTKSGSATPNSSAAFSRPQRSIQIAPNGVASANGASITTRADNGFYMSGSVGRLETGGPLRSRPVPMVTPPVSYRQQDENIDASLNSPLRMHTGNTRVLNKMSSVTLPGPYAGMQGVRSAPQPVPMPGVYHDPARQAREAQDREGKNFAAATKLLIQTEQQLATALSEAEALKKAERLLGTELSEAHASSRAEERLLSEISDAQNQLQKEQADIEKLRVAEATLRSQAATHDVHVSEIEAKYRQELEEANRRQERIEASQRSEVEGRHALELASARAEIEQLNAALRDLRQAQAKAAEETTDMAAIEASLQQATMQVEQLAFERDQAKTERDQAKLVAEQVTGELTNSRQSVEQLGTELARVNEELVKNRAMLQKMEADQASGDLTNARQSVEQLGTELARVNEELVKNKAMLHKMEAEQATLRKEKSDVEAVHFESLKRISELEATLRAAEQAHAAQAAQSTAAADSATAALTAELSGVRASMEQSNLELTEARSRLEAMQQEAERAVPQEHVQAHKDQIEVLHRELAQVQWQVKSTREEVSSSLLAKDAELLEAFKTIENLRADITMLQMTKVAGQDQGEAMDKLLEDADIAAVPSRHLSMQLESLNLEGLNKVEEDVNGVDLDGKSPADVFADLNMLCEEHIWRRMQNDTFHATHGFENEEFLSFMGTQTLRQSQSPRGALKGSRAKAPSRCGSCCLPSRR